jgi:beta-lactamase regulating signal transducer with metallopeptidase domain
MDVKKFLSKQDIGFYVGIGAIVMLLIGTIILSANGSMEYYKDANALVPVLGILAILFAVAVLVIPQFKDIPHIEYLWLVVVILAMSAFMVILSMRVESMAFILGSDLENDNASAQSALSNYFVGAVFQLIGIIAAIVASFFSITKKVSAAKVA